MAKRKRKAKQLLIISDELKTSPRLFSGVLGTFGVGGPIKRAPLQTRNGYPPTEREDIPEATEQQYKQLVDAGLYAEHITTKVDPDLSEGSTGSEGS